MKRKRARTLIKEARVEVTDPARDPVHLALVPVLARSQNHPLNQEDRGAAEAVVVAAVVPQAVQPLVVAPDLQVPLPLQLLAHPKDLHLLNPLRDLPNGDLFNISSFFKTLSFDVLFFVYLFEQCQQR